MKSMIDQQMLIKLESQYCQQEVCVHEKKSDKAIDIANKHQFINKRVWMIGNNNYENKNVCWELS